MTAEEIVKRINALPYGTLSNIAREYGLNRTTLHLWAKGKISPVGVAFFTVYFELLEAQRMYKVYFDKHLVFKDVLVE